MGSWNTVGAQETSVGLIPLCGFEIVFPSLPSLCYTAKRKAKMALGSGERMHTEP